MSSAFNHNQEYRPLRGGIAVHNPLGGMIGTIGMIATSDGVDRWLISCHHVLCRGDGGPFVDKEPIFQPSGFGPGAPVAELDALSADPVLDCVAAKLLGGVDGLPELLGIGAHATPKEPVVGMRVLKSGRQTGVTEGIVTAVDGDDVTVAVPPQFAVMYEMTEPGDSGAVWVDELDAAPVALHVSGNVFGAEESSARRISAVLAALGLQSLV